PRACSFRAGLRSVPRCSNWRNSILPEVSPWRAPRSCPCTPRRTDVIVLVPMNRIEAITRLRDQADAIKSPGATSLYPFGSFARDEATNESDLVLFVDYDPLKNFSLVDLVDIKNLLEDELGMAVDVTTRDSLHPALRADIEKSAIRVF